jgi:hypothetical protein
LSDSNRAIVARAVHWKEAKQMQAETRYEMRLGNSRGEISSSRQNQLDAPTMERPTIDRSPRI